MQNRKQVQGIIFEKHDPEDKVLWGHRDGYEGEMFFTFDGETIFSLFSDYPWALTPEQKAIFDKEDPYWAHLFSDRNGTTKEEYAGARAHERAGASRRFDDGK